MKKIILFFLILIPSIKLWSQIQNTFDTLRKDEISVSVLPALILLSGYDPISRYGVWNFGYKHYFKNKRVFRTSLNISPNWGFNRQAKIFLRREDTLNIFSSNNSSIINRVQLNIGTEKIFRIKNFTHGFGAELLLRTQTYRYQNSVYWYPAYVDPNGSYAFQTFSTNKSFGKIYNQIDSLSYSYEMKGYGIGLQLLYTLRYRINSRFYLSSSIGPYFVVVRYTYQHLQGNKELYKSYNRNFSMDGSLLFIADFSLAFRF